MMRLWRVTRGASANPASTLWPDQAPFNSKAASESQTSGHTFLVVSPVMALYYSQMWHPNAPKQYLVILASQLISIPLMPKIILLAELETVAAAFEVGDDDDDDDDDTLSANTPRCRRRCAKRKRRKGGKDD